MKKLLILITIVILTSCNNTYTTGSLCRDLMKERSSVRYNNRNELIPSIDSMLLKCRCDSLK